MAQVVILGSCVTRDIWRVCKVPIGDSLLMSRTSFASMFAPAVPDVADLPIRDLGDWEARQLRRDLDKSHCAVLLEERPAWIILDFIDERYDLLRTNGTIINYSAGLLSAGPLEHLSGERIPRLSDEASNLWRRGLEGLKNFLSDPVFAQTRLVLHRAYWATEYMDEGERRSFDGRTWVLPGEGPVSIEPYNALLRSYYDTFLSAFPDTGCVDAPASEILGYRQHQFGLSPFHYVDSYYRSLVPQLASSGIPGMAPP